MLKFVQVIYESFKFDLTLGFLIYDFNKYEGRPQNKFPARPTASKPFIVWSDWMYVIEQWRRMTHALAGLPEFSQ